MGCCRCCRHEPQKIIIEKTCIPPGYVKNESLNSSYSSSQFTSEWDSNRSDHFKINIRFNDSVTKLKVKKSHRISKVTDKFVKSIQQKKVRGKLFYDGEELGLGMTLEELNISEDCTLDFK